MVKYGNYEKKGVLKQMTKTSENIGAVRLLGLLPTCVSKEISTVLAGRRDGFSALREIMLRSVGQSRLVLRDESLRLCSRVSAEELSGLMRRITEGALYAHRDSIASGYVSIFDGIRVGVCGSARYDGDRLVGISEISSMLFRIPSGKCGFGEEIYSAFLSGVSSGMLIYSPPGVGKTTALRWLSARIGGGSAPRRVCIVDERLEFLPEDYVGLDVDILRGYKRRSGIEIATRTMSPDIIVIDEIGAEDSSAILDVLRCGIPIIASAHAKSIDEIKVKPSLRRILEIGAFDLFVGISRVGGGYKLKVDRL